MGRRQLIKKAFWVLSFLLAPVIAQATALEEEQDVEFEEEFELLQDSDVVFSASKYEQKVGFSPSAVVVITRKDIEESGATTLMDLLRHYPATHVYESDPIFPSLDVRNNYRVVLMIDGREVNHEFFVSPFFAILPVEIQQIERIEIVIGPNSAIYGANAVAAVINIFTRQPEDKPLLEAAIQGGETGWSELDLMVMVGAGPLAARISAGSGRSNAWMERQKPAKEVWRFDAYGQLELGRAVISMDSGFSLASGKFWGMISNIAIDDT